MTLHIYLKRRNDERTRAGLGLVSWSTGHVPLFCFVLCTTAIFEYYRDL